MVNDEIRKKIASLSPREKEVFESFCEGLKYKDISKKLYMSESAVKTHMTAVRLKFGVDQLSSRKITIELNNTYYSALKEIQNESDKIKTTEKELKNEPEPKPESRQKDSVEKTDTEIDMEIIKETEKSKEDVVEKDEKRDDKKPPLQEPQKPINEKKDGNQMKKTGQTKNDRFRSLKTIWRLISIAAIIFSGYMIYDHFFGSTPTQPAPSPEEPAVEQEQIAITDPEVIPTEVILPTVIPTSDEIIPTESPTYTPPAPPKPAFLFEDNFDTGLSEAWEIVSGNPIVVNGMLSADQVSWLMVGDPTWKNYSIEFNTDHPVPLLGSGTDFNAIGMRAQDIDNMYAFVWGQYQGESYIIEDGNWAEVPQSDYDVDDDETNLMLSVVNGQMTVYENGIKATSFFDTRFENGRIAVRIFSNAVIDDFKVKEILE